MDPVSELASLGDCDEDFVGEDGGGNLGRGAIDETG